MNGIVADIERASTHDGPGIRTVVFLKGCPLNCKWCHNPECISPKPEMLYYPEKCIGCGKCDEGCFTGAKSVCGKEMTPSEVVNEVLQDKIFYSKDGGLTISGGEPMIQANFTYEIASKAKENGIHTAIETSMYLYDEKIMKNFDLIMFDVKFMNFAKHIEYTGARLETILSNIEKANKLNIPMIARTPVIPNVNDSDIPEISKFLKSLDSVVKYELLPYHPLGISKAKALKKEQKRFDIPSKTLMEELNKYAFIR